MECISRFTEHTGRFSTHCLGGRENADEIRALLINDLHSVFRGRSCYL